VIEFGEFVRALSVFHPRAQLEEKAQFAFKIYDLKGTGFIDKQELKDLLVSGFDPEATLREILRMILYDFFPLFFLSRLNLPYSCSSEALSHPLYCVCIGRDAEGEPRHPPARGRDRAARQPDV
jgi:hypothetical protein